ncbi:MAG TPA: hypothetical protein VJ654_20765 [Noviherbaspirillum sp.]|nr:hypothetical protein [Noviherbaspirillum sp.]
MIKISRTLAIAAIFICFFTLIAPLNGEFLFLGLYFRYSSLGLYLAVVLYWLSAIVGPVGVHRSFECRVQRAQRWAEINHEQVRHLGGNGFFAAIQMAFALGPVAAIPVGTLVLSVLLDAASNPFVWAAVVLPGLVSTSVAFYLGARQYDLVQSNYSPEVARAWLMLLKKEVRGMAINARRSSDWNATSMDDPMQPLVNIDGTPVVGSVDIHGNSYGMTDHH